MALTDERGRTAVNCAIECSNSVVLQVFAENNLVLSPLSSPRCAQRDGAASSKVSDLE